jgi:hypothetical protein
MKRLVVFCAVLMLLFGGLTAAALADVQTGNFWISFDPTLPAAGHPDFDDGWEGPDGQQWFYYPNADNPEEGPFWNQWWYDDPPTQERWKEIFYDLTIEPWVPTGVEQPDGYFDRVRIALNWSNMEFPETGPVGPPPMPDEEYAIERSIIFDGDVVAGQPVVLSNVLDDPFLIPCYNPEWVSMDVWVEYTDPAYGNVIEIYGMLQHECVPEPSTFVLLGMGAFGLLMYIIRRRK